MAFPDNVILRGAMNGYDVIPHLEAYLGDSDRFTLRDRPDYSLLAQGLSDLGVYCALIPGSKLEPELWGWYSYGRRGEVQPDPLVPYFSAAGGVGKDADGYYVGLVLVHHDEYSAIENSYLIRESLENIDPERPGSVWKEKVRSVETSFEGREGLVLLLVKLGFRQEQLADWDKLLSGEYELLWYRW